MTTVRLLCRILASLAVLSFASLAAAQEKPLKVFILAGQSNMQGHAHVRTFEPMAMDPVTAPILKRMQNDDGAPTVCDHVWISEIGGADAERIGKLTAGYGAKQRGPKIGPEFTFGIYMQEHLKEPILLIKTAWGGKSLHTDFRSPSAGPYEFNEQQLKRIPANELEQRKAERAEATGRYYRSMIEHVEKVLGDIRRVYPDYDAERGYEIAGFVWFQGWNDMVAGDVYPQRGQPGGYDAYSDALTHFIRDVRKDLKTPDLPFVIGVMGAGGPTSSYPPEKQRYKSIHQSFRDAMAAPAQRQEFKGTVAAVWTENAWDMPLERLRAEDRKVRQLAKQKAKEESLARDDERKLLESMRSEAFSEEQRTLMEKSVSNQEYHYLGSAKILALIGKGFADAMADLLDSKRN